MDYAKQLDAFLQWLYTNNISSTSQLLYHTLLMLNHQQQWAEYFGQSTPSLCNIINVSENTLKRARDELKENRLIHFIPGKNRGDMTQYHIPCLYKVDIEESGEKQEKNKKNKVSNIDTFSERSDQKVSMTDTLNSSDIQKVSNTDTLNSDISQKVSNIDTLTPKINQKVSMIDTLNSNNTQKVSITDTFSNWSDQKVSNMDTINSQQNVVQCQEVESEEDKISPEVIEAWT